jgi:GntR family histidine utilization transcriptional repressor
MKPPPRTTYSQVKSTVLKRIRDRTWPPGITIPGEIDLAKEFGCARATVNRAMRELTDEGYVDRKRKAGTRVKSSPTRQAKFVMPLIRQEIEALGEQYRYRLIKREKLASPTWLCARLSLSSTAPVIHLHCLHYAGEKPFQFEDRWISLAAVPKADSSQFTEIGPNEWLVNEVPFTDVELTFSADGASDEIAAHLSTTPHAALFTIQRCTWLEKVAVTYAKLSYAPSYQMTTRL